MSLFTEVYQINLRVRDIEKACNWYQEVLGLSILKDYGKTVVMGFSKDSADTRTTNICLIELFNGESMINYEDGTHPVIAISADKAEDCKEIIQHMGANIMEGGSLGHFKFKDPDGNLIEAFLPELYEDDRYEHLR